MATKKQSPRKHKETPTPVLGVSLERLEQIVADAKSATPESDWAKLARLIAEYAEAFAADSWKGGGDPEAIPLIEQELELSRMRLNHHISVMQRKMQ